MSAFGEVARHRSREVMLYRQGDMNIIVNGHPDAVRETASGAPAIGAVALRVRDAAFAHRRALELGAWDMPTRASAMELNIPGIHGVGNSLIYFVDRSEEFSIYDVDFVWNPGVDRTRRRRSHGLHWFGLVQSVQADRTADWIDFYRALFGFESLEPGQCFGVLPKGTLLRSPERQLLLPAGRAAGRAPTSSTGTSSCCASASARPTCRRRCARCRSAAWCSSIARRCSRPRRAR